MNDFNQSLSELKQYAAGYITYGVPVVGDTVLVNGNTFTCVAAAPGANEFSNIAELEALIEALADLNSSQADGVIKINADAPGVAGNAITLALGETNTGTMAVSGATLTGGIAETLSEVYQLETDANRLDTSVGISSLAGTNPSITVTLQHSQDKENWSTKGTYAAITVDGVFYLTVADAYTYVRFQIVVAGINVSANFDLKMQGRDDADDGVVAWGNILGTLGDQTDLVNALATNVPYTGATGNVTLGTFSLTAGALITTGSVSVGDTGIIFADNTTETSITTTTNNTMALKAGGATCLTLSSSSVRVGSVGLLSASSTVGLKLKSAMADTAGYEHVFSDTSVTVTQSDARLFSIKNNTTTKASWNKDGIYIQNGLNFSLGSETVADDGSITLATAVAGFGFVQAGDNEEWVSFAWKADGTVTLIQNSTNVASADTDANLCLYDAGTGIVIKNRLGASKTLRYQLHYSS